MHGNKQYGSNDNRPHRDYRPRVEWETDKEFTSAHYDATKGGFCAKVSVLKVQPPRYSYELVWKMPDGKISRHFNATHLLDMDSIQQVVYDAQTYVQQQGAIAENMLKKQAEFQAKKDAEDKEKKANKKARHEANLARRREEDRARTAAGKSGAHRAK